jgi:hypothetical protein
VRELAERLANEPQRHADAVAHWALGGEKGARPESRVVELEAEHRAAEGERDGLAVAVDRVLEERARHVERNRDRLVKHADRLVSDCHGRLSTAIEAVERERTALAEAREVAVWARLFPDESAGRMPRFNTFAGGLRRALQPLGLTAEVDADRVISALVADAAWLRDAVGPEQRTALGGEQQFDLRHKAGWADDEQTREAERRERLEALEAYKREWGHYPA